MEEPDMEEPNMERPDMEEPESDLEEDTEEKIRALETDRDAAKAERNKLLKEKATINRDLKKKTSSSEERLEETLEKRIETLEEIIKTQEERIETLKERIETLDKRIEILEEEIAKFKEESAILYIAQAATAFQEAICQKVLPETFNPPRGATIRDMVDYLTGKEAIPTDEDIDEAKERWEKLLTDLQWTGWDYARKGMMKDLHGDLQAIIYLKEARNPIAHHDIEITTAISQLKDLENKLPGYKLVHIRELILNMDEKMKKCGLSHSGIKTEEMPERKRPRMSVQPQNTRK